MCDDPTRQYIKSVIKYHTEYNKDEILTKVEQVRGILNRTENKVDTLNGSVKDAHKKIRDLEEKERSRLLNCPHNDEINMLKKDQLTNTTLKQFIEEQENKRIEETKLKDSRIKWIVGLVGVGFTIITIIINIILHYIEKPI